MELDEAPICEDCGEEWANEPDAKCSTCRRDFDEKERLASTLAACVTVDDLRGWIAKNIL